MSVRYVFFQSDKNKNKNSKKWKFCVFLWFSRSPGTGIMYKYFFDIVYLRAGDAANTGNIHDFSWDDHGFLFGRTWKTHFRFVSLLKFVTRYCSNNSNEKTLKFNKKHQMHRNSKQSRVLKKVRIDEKHRISRIMSKMSFKISQ